MPLTPAEFAWQELLAVKKDMLERPPLGERYRQRRWSLCEAYSKVLAQLPTSCSHEWDKVGFKADRALGREGLRDFVEAQA